MGVVLGATRAARGCHRVLAGDIVRMRLACFDAVLIRDGSAPACMARHPMKLRKSEGSQERAADMHVQVLHLRDKAAPV
jgi:hypothetical protein